MPHRPVFALSRRTLLRAGGAAIAATALGGTGLAAPDAGALKPALAGPAPITAAGDLVEVELVAKQRMLRILPEPADLSPLITYADSFPGPIIRMRKGQRLRATHSAQPRPVASRMPSMIVEVPSSQASSAAFPVMLWVRCACSQCPTLAVNGPRSVSSMIRCWRTCIDRALAKVSERFGRLKLNGHLRRYSPLSRVVELESLALIAAHRAVLWRVLERHARQRTELDVVDHQSRAELAERQRQQLEREAISASLGTF